MREGGTHVAIDEPDNLGRRDVLGEEGGVPRVDAAVAADVQVPALICERTREGESARRGKARAVSRKPPHRSR